MPDIREANSAVALASKSRSEPELKSKTNFKSKPEFKSKTKG